MNLSGRVLVRLWGRTMAHSHRRCAMPIEQSSVQKGLSLPDFIDRYGTESQCEQALIAARWPDGFVCPACSAGLARTTFRREGRLYWQCAAVNANAASSAARCSRGDQAAADTLVPGHAAADPVQEQRLGAGLKRQLGVNATAPPGWSNASCSGRCGWQVRPPALTGPRRGRRRLPGRGAQRRQGRRGSGTRCRS